MPCWYHNYSMLTARFRLHLTRGPHRSVIPFSPLPHITSTVPQMTLSIGNSRMSRLRSRLLTEITVATILVGYSSRPLTSMISVKRSVSDSFNCTLNLIGVRSDGSLQTMRLTTTQLSKLLLGKLIRWGKAGILSSVVYGTILALNQS